MFGRVQRLSDFSSVKRIQFIMLQFFLLIGLTFSMVTGRVVRPDHRRLKDVGGGDTGVPASSITRIAIEVTEGNLNNVFLKGGFTNGNSSSCSGPAGAEGSCSISILSHNTNENSTSSYIDWADGDQFLDFYGAETGQGLHDSEVALGTPTSELLGKDVLHLLNPGHGSSRRDERFFYYVELELDCSETDGLFEVEVVTQDMPENRQRSPGNRRGFLNRDVAGGDAVRKPFRINFPKNFDFDELDTKIEASRAARRFPPKLNYTLHPDHPDHPDDQDDQEGQTAKRSPRPASDDVKGAGLKPPRALGWKANMDTASGPDARPFEVVPKRVYDSPRNRRFPPGSSKTCFGRVSFTAPYTPEANRFMGRCGYANIFAYANTYCEINGIPEIPDIEDK